MRAAAAARLWRNHTSTVVVNDWRRSSSADLPDAICHRQPPILLPRLTSIFVCVTFVKIMVMTSDEKGWSNSRPAKRYKIGFTLNEKLRGIGVKAIGGKGSWHYLRKKNFRLFLERVNALRGSTWHFHYRYSSEISTSAPVTFQDELSLSLRHWAESVKCRTFYDRKKWCSEIDYYVNERPYTLPDKKI